MDGPGLRRHPGFQRCVAALLRWNRRTGTHQQDIWNLQQQPGGYPAQQGLLAVASGAQSMMGQQSAGQRDWSAAAAVGLCTLDQGSTDRPVGMATVRSRVGCAQEEAVVVHRSKQQRSLSRDAKLTQTEQWPGKEWKATTVTTLVAA